jgi:trimeric autotransporter adhesin
MTANNVATGRDALLANTTGDSNVATGRGALFSNHTGNYNVASGRDALFSSTTGIDNIGLGRDALLATVNGNANVAVGAGALAKVRGARNIALGKDAGANVSGVRSDNIEIGNRGLGTDSATTRIGTQGTQTRAFMAGISATSIPGPTQAVVVNSAGQLGTATAAKAAPLSLADGRRLMAEIERLRAKVRNLGG